MFLLNVGYRWNLASSVDEVNGLLYLPCGNTSARLTRAALPECSRRLFDPQLYLAELDPETCPTACSRLATYPWFYAEVPAFDSGDTTRQGWEKAIKDSISDVWPRAAPQAGIVEAARAAIESQLSLSCTHIILPSPLISEREDEANTQGEWLDQGLAAVSDLEIGQPVLATLAIDEGTLNDASFDEGGFLETIADQVSSRIPDGIDGVYVLVTQTHPSHPFTTDSRVLRAYLRLSHVFASAGCNPVLINFADIFGKVCMGAGATGFGDGPSHSMRRLSLAGFQEGGGGVALPKLYSHRTAGEYLTETHLDHLVRKRLLNRIRDVTPYSQPLIEALERGRSAAQVPAWAESQNNLNEAAMHFMARLATETARVGRQGPSSRLSQTRDWLEDAAANAMYVESRVDDGIELQHAPTGRWLELLDEEMP